MSKLLEVVNKMTQEAQRDINALVEIQQAVVESAYHLQEDSNMELKAVIEGLNKLIEKTLLDYRGFRDELRTAASTPDTLTQSQVTNFVKNGKLQLLEQYRQVLHTRENLSNRLKEILD